MRRLCADELASAGDSASGLCLRADAVLERDGDVVSIVEGHVRTSFRQPDAVTAVVLEALDRAAVGEAELFALAMDAGGDRGALTLELLLRRLESGGWLDHVVVHGGVEIARRIPLGHVSAVSTRRARPTDRVRLSRFGLVRRGDAGLVAESTHGASQVVLAGPIGPRVVAASANEVTLAELADAADIDVPTAVLIVQELVDAGVLRLADSGRSGPDPEDVTPLALWSLPDLLFHTRSRVGRNEGGYGGTYRWKGRLEPAPALRQPFAPAVALPAVELDAVGASDPPLGQVMAARRSVRVHDDANPIDTARLGELLARVGRVRRLFHDGEQELSARQLPSGGALHELEIYPLVNLCEGIAPGLYHYDGAEHVLGLVRSPDHRTTLLSEYARRTALMGHPPQVVLLVTARFERTMWKYESMAYALSLKHVGVLYEATYLAATAMGLAVCGLGGGNSDAFAAASGIDAHVEASVGEMIVGSRPDDLPEDDWRKEG